MFEDKNVGYLREDARELALAYAVTIHKSQGSEFPAVVVPLSTSTSVMLQRNLLYTAVTRAKKLLVLCGSRKALEMCVRNARINHRFSRLAERLNGDPVP
jgi:exodeoxyribonuclease V alpha subunit